VFFLLISLLTDLLTQRCAFFIGVGSDGLAGLLGEGGDDFGFGGDFGS
jgi:hypothetical protein